MENDTVFMTDLEGKTDDKIRALELVEELRAKRADKQVIYFSGILVLSFLSFCLLLVSC